MKNKKSKLKKAILLCLCLYSGIACAQVSGTVLAYYGDNSLHNIIRNRPGYNEFLNASGVSGQYHVAREYQIYNLLYETDGENISVTMSK